MRFHEGDRVTVTPVATDPYILEFQRYARVAGRNDAGYMVQLDDTWPPRQTFGPIPADRLRRGWVPQDW